MGGGGGVVLFYPQQNGRWVEKSCSRAEGGGG